MGWFNKNKKKQPKNQENDANQEKERVQNHWTFSDDPLLNIEPVFIEPTDDNPEKKEALAPTTFEKTNKSSENLINFNEFSLEQKQVQNPLIKNDKLGNIINSARKKSEDIQNHVIENDPVIARLAKIEEMKRSGATEGLDDLYTDVNKSTSLSSYAKRAQDYHQQNTKNFVMETEIERKLRLQAESEHKRELNKIDPSFQINEPIIKRAEPKKLKKIPKLNNFKNNGGISENKKLEADIKQKILSLKEIQQQKLEKEAELNILEIEVKSFETDDERKEFLETKLFEFNDLIEKLENKISFDNETTLLQVNDSKNKRK